MEQGDHAIPANTTGVLLNIFGRIYPNVPDTLSDRIVYVDPNICYYSDTHGNLIVPTRNIGGLVVIKRGIRGDLDCNGGITPVDVAYLVNYVFRGWDVLCNKINGDLDCNGMITPLDVTYLVNYVYKQWPLPSC